jgi:hypothetical protein
MHFKAKNTWKSNLYHTIKHLKSLLYEVVTNLSGSILILRIISGLGNAIFNGLSDKIWPSAC